MEKDTVNKNAENVPSSERERTTNDLFQGMKEIYFLMRENNELQKKNNKYLKSISTATAIIAVILTIYFSVYIIFGFLIGSAF